MHLCATGLSFLPRIAMMPAWSNRPSRNTMHPWTTPVARGHTTVHVSFAVLAFTMFAIGSSFGCGGKIDVCTRAEQYLAACGNTTVLAECRVDAEAQCRAECLVDVHPSCADLYRYIDPDASTPLLRCYDSCARTFRKPD